MRQDAVSGSAIVASLHALGAEIDVILLTQQSILWSTAVAW